MHADFGSAAARLYEEWKAMGSEAFRTVQRFKRVALLLVLGVDSLMRLWRRLMRLWGSQT